MPCVFTFSVSRISFHSNTQRTFSSFFLRLRIIPFWEAPSLISVLSSMTDNRLRSVLLLSLFYRETAEALRGSRAFARPPCGGVGTPCPSPLPALSSSSWISFQPCLSLHLAMIWLAFCSFPYLQAAHRTRPGGRRGTRRGVHRRSAHKLPLCASASRLTASTEQRRE